MTDERNEVGLVDEITDYNEGDRVAFVYHDHTGDSLVMSGTLHRDEEDEEYDWCVNVDLDPNCAAVFRNDERTTGVHVPLTEPGAALAGALIIGRLP